ncbi:olfactory receptor 5V1-like [Discoglossus pictus]
MDQSNQTSVTNFILVGLSSDRYLQFALFFLFLVIYIIACSGNLLLIIMVALHTRLQSPMYFFLTNLSFIDIFLTSSIVPKLLCNTLAEDRSISFLGCATQLYFLLAVGATECTLLAVMAYDRYSAICNPLRYNTIMNQKLCICLAAGCWVVSFLNAIIQVSLTFTLPFCRSNFLNHFFCDMLPLFHLSCRETLVNEIVMYIAAGILTFSGFLLTLISYVHIISSIMNLRSTKGRQKTFSTCASHLTVVLLFYVNILFTYMHPRSAYSPMRDRTLSILYTAVTPMLNPIIYSVRNKDFLNTVREVLTRKNMMQLKNSN